MSRSRMSSVVTVFVALALALPLAARTNETKNSKTTASATMELVKDATIGGKQVKAGTYDVKADESKITLSHNGKVVAESPVEWKAEGAKSPYSSIVVDSGAVKEVHFNGKNRYAEVSAGSMETGKQ